MKLRPILESYNSFRLEINSAQYRHLFFILFIINRQNFASTDLFDC